MGSSNTPFIGAFLPIPGMTTRMATGFSSTELSMGEAQDGPSLEQSTVRPSAATIGPWKSTRSNLEASARKGSILGGWPCADPVFLAQVRL
jgi:hypothetical protein